MRSRRLVYLLMSCVVTLWGGAFVAIRILVRHASPYTVTLLRFALTTAGLLVVSAIVRPDHPRLERRDRGRLVVLAITGVAVYHLSLNYGERFVSATVASLIVASFPVLVALGARLVLKETIGPRKWAGIALALAGVVILVLWGTPGAELSIEKGLGAAVTILAPLAWTVYTIGGKPMVRRYGALPLTTWAMSLGTLLVAPLAIGPTLRDVSGLTLGDWGWLAFLAFLCSVFAYTVWLYALEIVEASELAVWVYLIPLLALGWAAIVLGERPTAFAILGGAMVLAGVILTERVAGRVGQADGEARVSTR